MIAFRDGLRRIDLGRRAAALGAELAANRALEALLIAGEIECALADLEHEAASRAAKIADEAALALVGSRDLRPLAESASALPACWANASVPEGFAYYGVHPLDYAKAAIAATPAGAPAHIVGLRTIGTTLSAAAGAALALAGHFVSRSTVRPTGHPYDRRVELDPSAAALARAAAEAGGRVLIVDEGPGRSGSSFLGAADALVLAGVDRSAITLLPSYEADPSVLIARDAARRWSELRRVVAAPTRARPDGAAEELSAGAWRCVFGLDADRLSGVWPAMERRKYLSEDGRRIFKFEGLGHYGGAVFDRSAALSALEIGPAASRLRDGFIEYERIDGEPFSIGDEPPLPFLARAIAARAELGAPAVETSALVEMAERNTEAALGRAIHVNLEAPRPVIADGKLAPHEFIRGGDRLVKVDGAAHGDDHFYPGPCDIAWDVAGAIIEWQMDAARADALVRLVSDHLGDRALAKRIEPWKVAYLAFRVGWLTMALDACPDPDDQTRLARELDERRRDLRRV